MAEAYKITCKLAGQTLSAGRNDLLGTLIRRSSTIMLEQLAVATINEPLATGFTILDGDSTFSVDASGNIAFLALPDYDTQRTYTLKIKSDRNRTYYIKVIVTIFEPDTILTGSEIIYNDTYIK